MNCTLIIDKLCNYVGQHTLIDPWDVARLQAITWANVDPTLGPHGGTADALIE